MTFASREESSLHVTRPEEGRLNEIDRATTREWRHVVFQNVLLRELKTLRKRHPAGWTSQAIALDEITEVVSQQLDSYIITSFPHSFC